MMKDEVKTKETQDTRKPVYTGNRYTETGDNTHMLIWILLAIAGMAGSVFSSLDCKKKKIKVNGGAFMGRTK